MAAVASTLSLVLNFQRTASWDGSSEEATPFCSALPRNSGQSALACGFAFCAGPARLLSGMTSAVRANSRQIRYAGSMAGILNRR